MVIVWSVDEEVEEAVGSMVSTEGGDVVESLREERWENKSVTFVITLNYP